MRGKFKSLTMVNGNGFFARTFDLDQLVTTLSGSNGAGIFIGAHVGGKAEHGLVDPEFVAVA